MRKHFALIGAIAGLLFAIYTTIRSFQVVPGTPGLFETGILIVFGLVYIVIGAGAGYLLGLFIRRN
jgi:hypothetical protein